jgi:chaperonin GroEL
VVLTQKDTTFIGYQSSAEVEDIIKSIREILDKKALSQPELDFHKKRLANFTSGIATIFIGGLSQPEIKEKLDRVEDAVRATDCAVREGILPGGGITLAKVAEKLPEGNPLKEVLTLPMRLLGTNLDQKNELIKKGIVEPYLVVKTALENAVNMAILIMTCDCIILPKFYDYEK